MNPSQPAPATPPAQPDLSFSELRALGLSIAGAELVGQHIVTLELTAKRLKAAHAAQNERCVQLEDRLATVQKWALKAVAGTQQAVSEEVQRMAGEPLTQNLSTAYKAIIRIAETTGAPLEDLTGLNPHEAAVIAADRANTAADDCMNYADDLEGIVGAAWNYLDNAQRAAWMTWHLTEGQRELVEGIIGTKQHPAA